MLPPCTGNLVKPVKLNKESKRVLTFNNSYYVKLCSAHAGVMKLAMRVTGTTTSDSVQWNFVTAIKTTHCNCAAYPVKQNPNSC
jgi:hypothetical protein